MRLNVKLLFSVSFSGLLMLAPGCRSHQIAVTVENRTGTAIRLLEVDYPNASFGADSLAAGQTTRSSIQVLGSGPVKVEYTAADRHQAQITGPGLVEKQEGQLQIVLLPEDKAEFHLH